MGLLFTILLHLLICGWMLGIYGSYFPRGGLFVFCVVIVLGLCYSYVLFFSSEAVVCNILGWSYVFEIYLFWSGLFLAEVWGLWTVIVLEFFSYLSFLSIETLFYGVNPSDLFWLYVGSQSAVGSVYNCELFTLIQSWYQPMYGELYGSSVNGIDWYYLWDDLFISVYDLFISVYDSGVNDSGVFSVGLGDFYSAVIYSVLEEQLSDPMYIYCEGLGLSVFIAEVWVVDAIADFILGSFWSIFFYMCIVWVTVVVFYLYVRVVLFVFCSYLEIEIGLSDVFVW